MPGDLIQAQYEQLDAIAGKFGNQAKTQADLQNQIKRGVQALQQGGWEGRGAAAFFAEMNGKVFPGLRRLIEALEQARSVTLEIKAILQRAEEEAANPFRGKAEKQGGGLWGKISEWVHGGLDLLGFVPGLGEIADGANALIYLAEGRHVEAAISAAAMIPILGDAGKVGKWSVKLGKEVLEEGAERVVKEGAETLVEQEARTQAKNAAQEYIQKQATRGIGARGHAAEEAAVVIAGKDAHLLDDAVKKVGGFQGNYAPGFDIASSKEISSVKTHWSDAAWNEQNLGLTKSALNSYRRDFDQMLGWGEVGKLERQADGIIRLRDAGYTFPDAIKNGSQADVARYLRDESVLRVPDDHVGPVQQMLKRRIQDLPGNYHLPGNIREDAIDAYVRRRIQGSGVTSGELRQMLEQ